MPTFELHADFDRDGRLTRNADERAARFSWPGAVVVPNLDRDDRRLPRTAATGSPIRSDYESAIAPTGDDDLLPIEIRVTGGTMDPTDRLFLRCRGVMHTRIRLSDTAGVIVHHVAGQPEYFVLSVPPSGVLSLTLQCRTIAGSPFGRVASVDRAYRPDTSEESRFELELVRRDSSRTELVEDRGRFTVAPFLLVDSQAPAVRMYMLRSDANVPSLEDARVVARAAGVPLIEVDADVTGFDSWLQDQYQHAIFPGSRWRQLVLHMPRLRRDHSPETVNDSLQGFVDHHFRSSGVGVFADLWRRELTFRGRNNVVVRPSFRQLEPFVKEVLRVEATVQALNRLGTLVPGFSAVTADTWIKALETLPQQLQQLENAATSAESGAGQERRNLLAGIRASARALVDAARAPFALEPGGVVKCVIAGQSIHLTPEEIRRVVDRARQMYSSANYGGNIESTPPLPNAPFGKIILGNAVVDAESRAEFMDPDLLRIFAKQKKQPVVEIDTTWLRVGHVDEMMAVVPHPRRSDRFAIVHASSRAALEIVRAAWRKYVSGLSPNHPNTHGIDRPSGVLNRLTNEGSHPVTRLFRGKVWRHIHRPAQRGEVSEQHEPPAMYLRLADAFTAGATGPRGINIHRIGYVPGPGEDRDYPADISVTEVLYCEADRNGASVNELIDNTLLAASTRKLEEELPGIPILPVPVLFDRVDNLDDWITNGKYRLNPTSAFSPDIANLQVLNGHLLVPKPYGPRMRTTDAIEVVRAAMDALGIGGDIRARVGPRIVARHRLTTCTTWISPSDAAYLYGSIGTIHASYGGLKTEEDVIAQFKDSFPGADAAELERKIIRPNRRLFTGTGILRDGFRKLTFDDGMVDLFELFAAAVVEETGARLHFIDTWFYHVRDGQIHCGTNVLRRAPRGSRLRDALTSPDFEFRAQT